jgi:CBS domain containing-hemolysin-like protein
VDLTWTVLLVLMFLVSEGFFSGSEIALISLNRFRLRHLAESGEKFAVRAELLLQRPDRIFGTTSVGTNLSVFSGTSVLTAFFVGWFGERADLAAFIVMAPVTLLFGEILPKIVFQHFANRVVRYILPPLLFSLRLFSPVLWITSRITGTLLRWASRNRIKKPDFVTREEIRHLVMMDEQKLGLKAEERKIIHNIFEFYDTTVENCMVPLNKLVAFEINTPLEIVRRRISNSGFNRFPIYRDRMYNIEGVIHAYSFLDLPDHVQSVEELIQPAYYVPPTTKIRDLLRELRVRGLQIAVVVNEYGGTIGIVTVEDLLEEIFGEIEDEYDATVQWHQKLSENRFLVNGDMEIDRINDELGLSLPQGDYETLNGFVIDALERIPKEEEMMAVDSYLLRIVEADQRAVHRVEILRVSESEEEIGLPPDPSLPES